MRRNAQVPMSCTKSFQLVIKIVPVLYLTTTTAADLAIIVGCGILMVTTMDIARGNIIIIIVVPGHPIGLPGRRRGRPFCDLDQFAGRCGTLGHGPQTERYEFLNLVQRENAARFALEGEFPTSKATG
jgi:hypothetical protein